VSEGVKTKKTNRFMELEGLRGIAALVVVVYHAMIMFYPGIAYGHNPNLAPVQNMRFEDNLYGNPLNVFLSGGFAVAIFFVLSGFVLSIGFFQTKKESIIQRLASKRYLRLMLPALASTILAFLLIAGGLAVNRQATIDITHSGSLSTVWAMAPSFFDAVQQGAISVFMQSGSSYNPVLWTMFYEFIGSFIVFGTLLMFGKSKFRWIAYGVVLFATYNTWFLGVILGMILADAYSNKWFIAIKNRRILLWLLLAVGLLLGGYPILSSAGTFYEAFYIPMLTDEQNASLYMSIGAILVVFVVLHLAPLSKLLAKPRVNILGRYTYSLYLTHTLILYTLCTSMFVLYSHYFGMNRAAFLAVISTVPVIIGVAWLFEKYIDAPSIKLANYISDVDLKGREIKFDYQKILNSVKIATTSKVMNAKQSFAARFGYDTKDSEAE
jgi:peptidoglycan/LPS O-acetylase OafA/YrhL